MLSAQIAAFNCRWPVISRSFPGRNESGDALPSVRPFKCEASDNIQQQANGSQLGLVGLSSLATHWLDNEENVALSFFQLIPVSDRQMTTLLI